MKIKSFKRIGTLVLACMMWVCMCFSMYTTASAAEIVPEKTIIETSVTPHDGANTVYPGNTLTLNLGSVSGYANATLTFVTASEASSGTLSWKLYCSGVKIKSGTVGVNDMQEYTMLLSAGTYTVEITNTASQKVSAFAYFK